MLLIAIMLSVSFARNALWHDDGVIWTDSLEKTVTKARGYNELGLHLIATGNYEEAHRILTRSLALNAYQPVVYINLGIVLEHLNRIDEAVTAYEQVIRFQPGEPAAYYNAGILYYNIRHDREKALLYLLKAAELDPREPDAHLYLGRIYQDGGDTARSRNELELYQKLK